ncbi:MAG: hypothetical protein HW396_1106 [Candidatus Dadabacteria bacterium]|nr:hypothetical protein [Candidatus Dadabacteria bacterium]
MISKSNIALKERAVTIKALDEGIQTILFRKGGIHEEGREFRIEYDRFLLYPTYEHQREESLKDKFRKELYTILHDLNDTNTLKIRNWATISHIAEITQMAQINALSPYYIWNNDYLYERLKWRPRKPLYMLFLKVYRLLEPKTIEIIPEYSGCKSWANIREEFSLVESRSVLNDHEFNQKLEMIKATLQKSLV